MGLKIVFECDKCGTTAEEKLDLMSTDGQVYEFLHGQGLLETSGGIICGSCAVKYNDEYLRAKKLAEAEVNARFWREED